MFLVTTTEVQGQQTASRQGQLLVLEDSSSSKLIWEARLSIARWNSDKPHRIPHHKVVIVSPKHVVESISQIHAISDVLYMVTVRHQSYGARCRPRHLLFG